MKFFFGYALILAIGIFHFPFNGLSQNHNPGNHFSSVNPAMFKYSAQDIHIQSPEKQNGGNFITTKNKNWSAKWDNGYPSVLPDGNNIDVYISLVTRDAKPNSDVAIGVLRGDVNNLDNSAFWTRPELGIFYWDNVNKKLETSPGPGLENTNIISPYIEGMGFYQDYSNNSFFMAYFDSKSSSNPDPYQGKNLYGHILSEEDDVSNHFLSGSFNANRTNDRVKFTFPFIQGNTHNQIFSSTNNYLFSSRHRVVDPTNSAFRYRRVMIGETTSFADVDVEMYVGLDGYGNNSQPYALQAQKLPGFENDMFFGFVTVYSGDVGTRTDGGDDRQHSELAVSNNGIKWRWLKPGSPFIENGLTGADDENTVNMATPVVDPQDDDSLLYFYFGSKEKHSASNRQSGLLYAKGTYGKIAGLTANGSKTFQSPTGKDQSGYEDHMLTIKLQDALKLKADTLFILGDYPFENSKISLGLYAYDQNKNDNKEGILAGSRMIYDDTKNPERYQKLPMTISYEPFGQDTYTTSSHENPRLGYFYHFNKYAKENVGTRNMVRISEIPDIKVLLEAIVENDAIFYGFAFNPYNGNGLSSEDFILNSDADLYTPEETTLFTITADVTSCQTHSITDDNLIPNQSVATNLNEGSFAVKVKANSIKQNEYQHILGVFGDQQNHMKIYFDNAGHYRYLLKKNDHDFINLSIKPSDVGLTSFVGQEVILVVEATSHNLFPNTSSIDNVLTSFTLITQSGQTYTNSLALSLPTDPAAQAQAKINVYNLFTSFLSGANTIKLAGDQDCLHTLDGVISQVEISRNINSTTDPFYNSGSSGPHNFVVNTESFLEELPSKEIDFEVKIYPNPSTSNFELTFDISKDQPVQIDMVDLNGRILSIREKGYLKRGGYTYQVYTGNLSSGIYIVRLDTAEGTFTKKVIVKK